MEATQKLGDVVMLTGFDHVNVKTANLAAMVTWYEGVLGLRSGKRPDFPFPGAWMYLGDHAVVHLVSFDESPSSIDPKIEHFAFRATGLREFLSKMNDLAIDVQVSEVPGFGITQVNIWDPDGNHIHVDFEEVIGS